MAGKIKKLLENELVGGTQTTDVYPVTSTKAVYDENNERLDNIINKIEPGIIYDVSANNDGAVFESLSALLSSSNLSTLIPTSVRHGGMTIRYIQSSDNKYVQYFLTKDEWSTSEGDWEKMNLETEVKKTDLLIGKTSTNVEVFSSQDGKYIRPEGPLGTYAPMSISNKVTVKRGDVLLVKTKCTINACLIGEVTVSSTVWVPLLVGVDSASAIEYLYVVQKDCEIQMSYYTEGGIELAIFRSVVVTDVNNLLEYKKATSVKGLYIINGATDIKTLISSVVISPVDPYDDISDYDIRLVYVGFNDPNGYTNKLVCQIRWIKDGDTYDVLLDSFTLNTWVKNKEFYLITKVNDIPIRITVTTSNENVGSSIIIKGVDAIIDTSYKYALPQKTLVQNGTNLINQDNRVDGWMVNAADGTFEEIGSVWALYKWIKVLGLSQITFGINGVAGITNVYSYAFYDRGKNYISGEGVYPTGITEPVNVPSNAAYLCFTGFVSAEYQINAGSSILPFELYQKPYYYTDKDINQTPWLFKATQPNVVHVGKGVGFDYNTLQDAMDGITDDSENNRYVIIVHPGTYDRFSQSDASPRRIRYMSIIGVDREAVKVVDNSGNYYTPPFECYMDGTVENMSFIMASDAEHYSPHDENDNYSYALHIDFEGERTTVFRNCYFESNTGPAVGLGTYANNRIVFENCHAVRKPFRGRNDLGAWYYHGCVYADRPNQELVLKNCIAENRDSASNSNGFVLHRVRDGLAADVTLTLQNCYSGGTNGAAGGMVQLSVSKLSFGNNVAYYNYNE